MNKGLPQEKLVGIIMAAASPVAASLGLAVWGVEIVGGGRTVVRIYVDRADSAAATAADGADAMTQGGVSVDQCAEISRLVGLALEVEDVMPGAWVLEVSSPGFERVFFSTDQMVPYIGRTVDVMLTDPHPDYPGRRRFKGPLLSVEGNRFVVEILLASGSGEELVPVPAVLGWDMVKKAHLVHVFPEVSRPGGKRPGAGGRDGGKQQ
jgi:ribosome maturation factor RimP